MKRKMLLSRLHGTNRYNPKKAYSRVGKRHFDYGAKIPRSLPSPAITKFSASYFRRGEEVKTCDVEFSGAYALGVYTPDTVPLQQLPINNGTGTVQALNLIQQGAGVSQRIGNKICMKSLRLRLAVSPTGKNMNDVNTARVMVLYDRNPNGAYVASNNILSQSRQDNTIQTGSCTDNINPNYFDRFVTLMDKTMILSPVSTIGFAATHGFASSETMHFIIDEYISLKNLETTYNGTASPLTISYINIGALLILVYGTAVPNSTDGWQYQGTARLRFKDN